MIFLLVIFSTSSCYCLQNQVKKCCPSSQILFLETLECKKARRDVPSLSLLPPTFLNRSAEDPESQMVIMPNLTEIELKIEPIRCLKTGESKVLELTTEAGYFISTSGDLVSLGGEFDPSFDLGDFCIDLGERVSATHVPKNQIGYYLHN